MPILIEIGTRSLSVVYNLSQNYTFYFVPPRYNNNKLAPVDELAFICFSQTSMTQCRLVCVDWSIEISSSSIYWTICLLTKLSIIW